MLKYRKATRLEIVAIGDKLRETCAKRENGMCLYRDGWDDLRVATELGVPAGSVAALRQEMMGKLRPHCERPDDRVDELAGEIAQLTVDLGKLMAEIQQLRTQMMILKGDLHHDRSQF